MKLDLQRASGSAALRGLSLPSRRQRLRGYMLLLRRKWRRAGAETSLVAGLWNRGALRTGEDTVPSPGTNHGLLQVPLGFHSISQQPRDRGHQSSPVGS